VGPEEIVADIAYILYYNFFALLVLVNQSYNVVAGYKFLSIISVLEDFVRKMLKKHPAALSTNDVSRD
jgi:hypothetical protein